MVSPKPASHAPLALGCPLTHSKIGALDASDNIRLCPKIIQSKRYSENYLTYVAIEAPSMRAPSVLRLVFHHPIYYLGISSKPDISKVRGHRLGPSLPLPKFVHTFRHFYTLD